MTPRERLDHLVAHGLCGAMAGAIAGLLLAGSGMLAMLGFAILGVYAGVLSGVAVGLARLRPAPQERVASRRSSETADFLSVEPAS